MKKGNIPDIHIYSSDMQRTNVSIGEWKAYRKEQEAKISEHGNHYFRLCTYADLVCDYIKLNREVMRKLGITGIPSEREIA